jgi:phosphatidylinositol alpha-1,6-mannosyltransferase
MENLGGMQRVAIDLHDSLLAHRGVDARALVLRSAWSERGIRTPLFLAHALREIRRMARGGEIDAILFSSMVTGALAVPLRNILKRNGIVTASIVNGLDATTPAWPYPAIVRRSFDALDVVLPISTATANACYSRGLSPAKTTVVPLGIRLDRFMSPGDRREARANLLRHFPQIAGSASLVLCTVGRLVPRKGVEWFVSNVMPNLPADVVYVVAGDGPDRARVEQAIAKHNLRTRVILAGAVTDSTLETIYHGADLFVMPNVPVANDMEGFGLVLLEAALCGLPAIASRLEGITDVISEGENGVLVESGKASEFASAIDRFRSDKSLLASAAGRARLHTISKFGWTGVIDRYIEVIQSVSG